MEVLFNADDFGLTAGVTDGIISAFQHGVIQSTTLMMNGLAVDEAIKQAKQHPKLLTGIHLTLTWGKPLRSDVDLLVDDKGFFKYSKTNINIFNKRELLQIEAEWRTQIHTFINSGLILHHIDSHHHVHGWPEVKDIVIMLAEEFAVPVRYAESLNTHPQILLTEQLWLGFFNDGVNKNVLQQLKKLDVPSIEVMTHPGFVDNDLKRVSSYVHKREEELEILCSMSIPKWAKKYSR